MFDLLSGDALFDCSLIEGIECQWARRLFLSRISRRELFLEFIKELHEISLPFVLDT